MTIDPKKYIVQPIPKGKIMSSKYKLQLTTPLKLTPLQTKLIQDHIITALSKATSEYSLVDSKSLEGKNGWSAAMRAEINIQQLRDCAQEISEKGIDFKVK